MWVRDQAQTYIYNINWYIIYSLYVSSMSQQLIGQENETRNETHFFPNESARYCTVLSCYTYLFDIAIETGSDWDPEVDP